uniref:Attractin n=1 Tax=Aplysia vaccaria TaxID=144771 RepID=ATT_APLVA|nr:RecName: Full=Attractin [Aplysia vaccaria]
NNKCDIEFATSECEMRYQDCGEASSCTALIEECKTSLQEECNQASSDESSTTVRPE